jgi:hypothetical protein
VALEYGAGMVRIQRDVRVAEPAAEPVDHGLKVSELDGIDLGQPAPVEPSERRATEVDQLFLRVGAGRAECWVVSGGSLQFAENDGVAQPPLVERNEAFQQGLSHPLRVRPVVRRGQPFARAERPRCAGEYVLPRGRWRRGLRLAR